ETAGVLGGACVAGAAATGRLPYLNSSAVVVFVGAVGIASLFFAGLRAPIVPFAALLVGFPVGDLIRKAGTGDPRLILLRDVLLVGGVVMLSARARLWRDVASACRAWLLPLAGFGAWFLVASVNSAVFANVRVPLIGARLYFEYLPLIGLAWYVAQDPVRLRRTITFVATVLCLTTIVGVAHAVAGPNFLPGTKANTELFTHLDLQRATTGQSAAL